jgi:antitoxin VapB
MPKSNKSGVNRRRERVASPAVPTEAKVFMTGRSQAVRLPKEFRLSGSSVRISRLGNSIVLTPKTADRWAGLFAALDEFPRGLNIDRDQEQLERPDLLEAFAKFEE